MSTNRQRVPYGQLTPLVKAHLRAHPDVAFTPWELGHVLGHSHGTIRRILVRLTAAGTVDLTGEQPARFRHHL
jgi:DNA-binding GntR family transcriptional regulator